MEDDDIIIHKSVDAHFTCLYVYEFKYVLLLCRHVHASFPDTVRHSLTTWRTAYWTINICMRCIGDMQKSSTWELHHGRRQV